MRKSSTVCIWQHGKRTDDYKIILNYVRKIDEKLMRKEAGKGPNERNLLWQAIDEE